MRDALELGYRHIDTARPTATRTQVGQGLHDSGLNRDEVFLTTKLWHAELTPPACTTVEQSLRDLRTDYVDLLLIHWPNRRVPLAETLGAMHEAREAGRVRHLGVANFPTRAAARGARARAALCDQVEYHPYLGQPQVLALARERDLMVTAYSPLAQGEVLRDPVIGEIARGARQVARARSSLRWLLDQPQRRRDPEGRRATSTAPPNLDVFDFELVRRGARPDRRPASAAGARSTRRLAPDWD